MEKIYALDGHTLSVLFEPKLVRIQGSKELLAFLSNDLNTHTLELVKLIKGDYLALLGEPLKITNSSLAVEIWGHLYASKFASIIQELIRLQLIENLTEHVKKRSDTIDCGEAEVDSNRKFWDVLAKFKALIVKLL